MSIIPNLDARAIKGQQTVNFPDMLSVINGYKVRYRLSLDSSYLGQSTAVVDVWNPATMSWNEVWKTNLAVEFTMAKGPTFNKECLAKSSRMLASVNNPEGAEFIAKSWKKVLYQMNYEAGMVLA